MRAKPYPAYKPSGVVWLGDVPAHWAVLAIKRQTPVRRGASPRPIDDPNYFDEDGEYAWVRISDVTASGGYLERTEQRLSPAGAALSVKLHPGALFLSIAATVGEPCITRIKCCIHDGFVYFPLFRGDSKFLFYVFASGEPYRGLGKLGTQLNLNTDTVGAIQIALPDIAEQRAIAAFLDRETGRIDMLVAKKQELIERLQEKRTALISHAVTRGLDPKAKLKPSGLPWLGDIPAHWEITPLGYLVRFMGGATPDKAKPELWEGTIPWVSPKDMKVAFIGDAEDHVAREALDSLALKLIRPRAILIVVRGMILAHSFPIAITTAEMTINQDMKALLCGRRLLPEFLALFLTGITRYIVSLADESAHGTRKFETKTISALPIALPSRQEQKTICENVEGRVAKLDSLARKAEDAIERLQEYRTALITAAVTGKIDVRLGRGRPI